MPSIPWRPVNAIPDETAGRYRRQQRRRAAIAWITAVLCVGLFVVAVIAGGNEESKGHEHPNPFGYSMTAKQYAALRPGLEQQLFVNRLEQTGLPENLTRNRYVRLFPPHGDDLVCSYWEIDDHLGVVARVCFSSSEGRLVQKLERTAVDASGTAEQV
jgi:hypothetical protein